MEFTALEASGTVIRPQQQVLSPTPNGQLRKLKKYRHAEMSVNYRPRAINALEGGSQPVVSRTPNDRLRKLHECGHAEMYGNYRPEGTDPLFRVSKPVVLRTPNDRLRKMTKISFRKKSTPLRRNPTTTNDPVLVTAFRLHNLKVT